MEALIIKAKRYYWTSRSVIGEHLLCLKQFPRLIWDPHQRIWNWRLVRIVTRKTLPDIDNLDDLPWTHQFIIRVDTLFLWISALTRRVRRCGIRAVFKKANVPSDIVVLYFDLGTHKDGRELGFMINQILPGLCTSFQAYGFEASRPCAAEAAGHFSRNSNVKIVHAAICDKPPKSGVIQLYVDGIKGLGNSLFREATGQVEHVPAIRLSQWITQKNLNLSEHICLIRMNIEGAEFDVARDLVESGFAVFMDGFFGMWDDVSKICPDRDREFRKFLKQSKIYPFPFNGRDMRFKLRTTCIEYEVHTAVHAGLERLRSW